ncbi:unnamed protein product [Cuscuta campestris]|uniref:Uncharacterized protein n=1 Tax=Cuscuta campestris TaxID=132261 RepID=A0A484M7H5_9ASTE|nr:unnamed protein product [Cuscuta campestris]
MLTSNLLLRQHAISWWVRGNLKTFNGALKIIILPGIIAWNLWKASNAYNYDGNTMSPRTIIQQIGKLIQARAWTHQQKKWVIHDKDFDAWEIDKFWRKGKKGCSSF